MDDFVSGFEVLVGEVVVDALEETFKVSYPVLIHLSSRKTPCRRLRSACWLLSLALYFSSRTWRVSSEPRTKFEAFLFPNDFLGCFANLIWVFSLVTRSSYNGVGLPGVEAGVIARDAISRR